MNEDDTIQSLRRDMALQVARLAWRLGDTQWAAASRLGIPQPTMSKIINGRVSDLSIEFLLRIAVRAGLAITLQTGRAAEEAGAFLSGLGGERSRTRQSKLAKEVRTSLIKSEQRLTPAERLEAFLEHNQLISTLYEAARAAEQSPVNHFPSAM